jgi:MoaA/NifB/PqqE/SkfB family radical SAM enzyme
MLEWNAKHILGMKRHPLWGPFPLYAKIEIDQRCNLKCIMCFRESGITSNEFMTLEYFKDVVDKLGPGLCEVWPHGFGEPMIHPQFFEMMEYLKEKGIMWSVATNGTYLNSENNKKLLETGAKTVRISMDAGKREEYERIRVGADFNLVMAGIMDLIRQRDEGGYKTKVALYSVVGVDTFKNVDDVVRLHYQLGTDHLTISDMSYGNEFGDSTASNSMRMAYSDRYLHNLTYDLARDETIHFGAFYKPKKRECVYTKLHCYIHANGDFYPCTCTPGHEEPLWNMSDVEDWKHLRKLYSDSKIFEEFREKSMPDKLCYACEVCASWAEDLSDII